MPRDVIFSFDPRDEVYGLGGTINKISNRVESIKDFPYIVYICISDHEVICSNKSVFISKDYLYDVISINSKNLGYNWETIFAGRKYFNKLHLLDDTTLYKKIKVRLDFFKPKNIYLPNKSSLDSDKLNKSVFTYMENNVNCNIYYYAPSGNKHDQFYEAQDTISIIDSNNLDAKVKAYSLLNKYDIYEDLIQIKSFSEYNKEKFNCNYYELISYDAGVIN